MCEIAFDTDAAENWLKDHASDPAAAFTNCETDNAFMNEDDGGIETSLIESWWGIGGWFQAVDVAIKLVNDYTDLGVTDGIEQTLTGQAPPTEAAPKVTRHWHDVIMGHMDHGMDLVDTGPKDLHEDLDQPTGVLLQDPPKPPPGERKWPEPLKVNWPEPVSLR